jgi:hypothetical protein
MNDSLTLILIILAFFLVFYIKEKISIFFSKLKIKYFLNKSNRQNGFVYIISNKAFLDDIVKIGMTNRDDYNKRIGELFNTSIPYPFDVEYIFPHSNPLELEKTLHRLFADKRLNSRREFFKIDKEVLKKELQSLNLLT